MLYNKLIEWLCIMESIKNELIEILKEIIDSNIVIDDELGFFDMGLSSLTVFTFCEQIRDKFNVDCDESVIFDYPNIMELSEYISSKI